MGTHQTAAVARHIGPGRRSGGRRMAADVTVHWHVHHTDRSIDYRHRVERAREEIEAAIMLVAGGHFPRVVISNLADCARAVRDLRGLAEAAGVELKTFPRDAGRGCDLVVLPR